MNADQGSSGPESEHDRERRFHERLIRQLRRDMATSQSMFEQSKHALLRTNEELASTVEQARSAVLAAGWRTLRWPGFGRELSAASSHIVLTEPVPDVLEELGWTGGEPIAPLDAVRMARHKMFFDSNKAVRELGLPQTPARRALADAARWFLENGYIPPKTAGPALERMKAALQ